MSGWVGFVCFFLRAADPPDFFFPPVPIEVVSGVGFLAGLILTRKPSELGDVRGRDSLNLSPSVPGVIARWVPPRTAPSTPDRRIEGEPLEQGVPPC